MPSKDGSSGEKRTLNFFFDNRDFFTPEVLNLQVRDPKVESGPKKVENF